MRYIPVNCLREDQILANDLVINNKVLLRRGMSLNDSLIKRIHSLGFQGLYIEDDISKDLIIAGLVSEELKLKAIKEVKTIFLDAGKKNTGFMHLRMQMIDSVIEEILDEIHSNRKMMVNIIDLRSYDDYTFSHCLNVTILSIVIGSVMGIKKRELQKLAMGSLVHDIGKMFIEKEIINKNDKLTDEEYEKIKNHCRLGFDYIKHNCSMPGEVVSAVLSHHERFNGQGYPEGLSGKDIPLFGRIISVADVYDAMISDRPYRTAMLPSESIEFIMGGNGTLFDPTVVAAFVKKVAPYPVGTCVKLSNDIKGIVVENFESSGMRPKIQIISNGKLTQDMMDLTHDASTLNLTVKEVINI